MRHGNKINALGRKKAHREAMLANMACSLIEHKRINTTVTKAKELRKYVEPLITKSKMDSTHSRRVVFSYLKSKDAVSELFREVAPKVAERPGGYLRILKTGRRLGDSAEMCMVELVDFNELLLNAGKPAKAKRSRRGGKKKSTSTEGAAPATEAKAEKAAEPKAEASPAAEKEVKEAPKAKEAKAEEPKGEAPKAEAKKEEAPKAEAKKEAPKAEEKKEEAPKTEAKEEAPKAEEKKEEPKEEKKADDAPKAEKEEKKDDSDDKEDKKKSE